jgi:hypothetical protein
MRLRVFGDLALAAGEQHWLEIPRAALWVF